MKKVFSKVFVGIGITTVSIPVLLLALFVVIEVVGFMATLPEQVTMLNVNPRSHLIQICLRMR
ncbi:hypothetical protein [Butyrivibrio sp. AD3002]|uniref:hypothetical protein n=1 Tax=Butyrivibrio sp. AD3002 TaxID=1280670 RepID=UPI0003B710C1|nr:hypothetical protein [Butyrivibrio sp. AD3002]